MAVDASELAPAVGANTVLAQVSRSDDISLVDDVSAQNLSGLEGVLLVVGVDEVQTVAGLFNVVIVGVRVPGVLVAAVTGVGASSTDGITAEGRLASLGNGAETLSGETVVVVLHEAVLGDVVGTEVNVAGVTAGGLDHSAGDSGDSTLQVSDRAAHGLNHVVLVLINEKTAEAVPSVRAGSETTEEVLSDFVVILIINLSLETVLVDTVGDGLFARLAGLVLARARTLTIEDPVVVVGDELIVLLNPLDLTVKLLRNQIIIVVLKVLDVGPPGTRKITSITLIRVDDGGKAHSQSQDHKKLHW